MCIKLTEDHSSTNSFYASLGGVTNQEMMSIEMELLTLLNFKLTISAEEFDNYKAGLCQFSAE